MEVTDKDVAFTPTYAEKSGKYEINISFNNQGSYKDLPEKTIKTTVEVLDPEEEDIALKVAKKVSIHVKANDTLQKYGIHLIKTDQDGNKLAGAIFALKAKTDIVNSKGENILRRVIRSPTLHHRMISLNIWNLLDCRPISMQRMEQTVICMR